MIWEAVPDAVSDAVRPACPGVPGERVTRHYEGRKAEKAENVTKKPVWLRKKIRPKDKTG